MQGKDQELHWVWGCSFKLGGILKGRRLVVEGKGQTHTRARKNVRGQPFVKESRKITHICREMRLHERKERKNKTVKKGNKDKTFVEKR